MKRLILLSVLCLGPSAFSSAQSIPIQGTGQKTAYADSSEWPFFSAQGHWGPANDMPLLNEGSLLNSTVGHLHVECTAPIYGEISVAIDLACQIQLFHIAGHVTTASNSGMSHTITWAAVGVPQQDAYDVPVMIGNPMGVVKFPFTLHLDPSQWAAHPHGWSNTRVMVRVAFDRAGFIETGLTMPFFAMLDPDAPLNPSGGDGFGPVLGTDVNVGSPNDAPSARWGEYVAQSHTILPVFGVPMAATDFWSYYWTTQPDDIIHLFTYSATDDAPPAVALARADIDLHNGSEGRALTPGHYDPREIGPGAHKVAMIWKADTFGGNTSFAPHESAAALFVINVNVADGTSPPTTCTDPTAMNVGGPLPCVFTPPPPPPPPINSWHLDGNVGSWTFWHDDNALLRICGVNNLCTILGVPSVQP